MTQEINIGVDEYTLRDIEVGNTVRVNGFIHSDRTILGDVVGINDDTFAFDTPMFNGPVIVSPNRIIEIL